MLQKRVADRKHPPQGITLQMRLNEVKDIIRRVETLMDQCPPDLSLNLHTNSPDKYVYNPSTLCSH